MRALRIATLFRAWSGSPQSKAPAASRLRERPPLNRAIGPRTAHHRRERQTHGRLLLGGHPDLKDSAVDAAAPILRRQTTTKTPTPHPPLCQRGDRRRIPRRQLRQSPPRPMIIRSFNYRRLQPTFTATKRISSRRLTATRASPNEKNRANSIGLYFFNSSFIIPYSSFAPPQLDALINGLERTTPQRSVETSFV